MSKDAEDLEPVGVLELGLAVFVVRAHHVGVFASAGAAPRRPEIDQHVAAAQIAQLHLLPLGVGHGDFRRLVADAVANLPGDFDRAGGQLNGFFLAAPSGPNQGREGQHEACFPHEL